MCSLRTGIISGAFVAALFGCATNPEISTLTSEQRAKLNTIEVLRGPTSQAYRVLGQVKGLSCHRNAYQRQTLTEDEALQGVKLNAALMGADAVVNAACQVNSGADLVNNCWSSIVCVGDAVKYSQ